MKFEQGHPKVGGRQKGSPNKQTLQLMEKCKEANFDPVKEFFAKYMEIKDPSKQCDLLLKFLEFIVPKRTRIEGELEIDDSSEAPRIQLTQENIIQFIQAARGNKPE